MQKPSSMKKFDLFFFGSLLLSAVGLYVGWDAMIETVSAQNAEAPTPLDPDMLGSVAIGGFFFGILLYIGLWFLISVLRIEFVKWVYIALVLYGLIQMPAGFTLAGGFNALHIPSVLSTLLSLVSIWMLFRPDSKEWFAKKSER